MQAACIWAILNQGGRRHRENPLPFRGAPATGTPGRGCLPSWAILKQGGPQPPGNQGVAGCKGEKAWGHQVENELCAMPPLPPQHTRNNAPYPRRVASVHTGLLPDGQSAARHGMLPNWYHACCTHGQWHAQATGDEGNPSCSSRISAQWTTVLPTPVSAARFLIFLCLLE